MKAHFPRCFSMAGLRIGGTLLAVYACAAPLVSRPPQQQVVVVSVSGEWTQVRQGQNAPGKTTTASLQNPIRFGQTLNTGAICLFGSERSSIVLKYSTPNEDKLYPFPCEKTDLAGSPTCLVRPRSGCAVDLDHVRDKKGIMATIGASFSALMSTVTAQPDKYMVAASRGADSELADAVISLDSGQIDLQAVFREMDPGVYYVEMTPLSSASLQAPPSRVNFAKGQSAPIAARGVQPGIYKLALVTEKGEPGDSDCWILVVASPEYPQTSAAFAHAVSESAKLPEEMDAGATRALLRAYLESLGDTKAGASRP